MPTKALHVLLLLWFLLQQAQAQNADLTNDPTSSDLLLLQVLNGERSIGNWSILPPRLDELLTAPTTLDTFRRYIATYYVPLDDITQHHQNFLTKQRGRFAVATLRDSIITLRLDAAGYARVGATHIRDDELYGTGRLSVRAIGTLSKHWSFLLDLANGALIRGTPERAALTDPDIARSPRVMVDQRSFYDRAIGAVQYQGSLGRIRLGRDVIGWGYSPLGGLLLSVPSPMMDHVLVDLTYGLLRFSYVHGAVVANDTSGRPPLDKYVAAHRLQLDLSSNFSLAICDAVVYSGRGLDLTYLNPLGFYVSSGLLSSRRNEHDNSLLSLEAAWRPIDGTLLYGTLLADDISFSTLTDTSVYGNNNKYAWQIGLTQLAWLGTQPLILGGEYVRINPFVYSHRSMVNSWTNGTEVMGALEQPNSDRWTVHATFWLAPRLRFNLRGTYQRWGENWLDSTGRIATVVFPSSGARIPVGNVGCDASRGDGDVLPEPFAVGNRFLRGNVSHTRRVQLHMELELLVNVFISARAEYMLRTGGNNPNEQVWGWIQLRLGY